MPVCWVSLKSGSLGDVTRRQKIILIQLLGFLFYAVGFGLVTRYWNGSGWTWSVVAGLLFAGFVTGFFAFRDRYLRD